MFLPLPLLQDRVGSVLVALWLLVIVIAVGSEGGDVRIELETWNVLLDELAPVIRQGVEMLHVSQSYNSFTQFPHFYFGLILVQ